MLLVCLFGLVLFFPFGSWLSPFWHTLPSRLDKITMRSKGNEVTSHFNPTSYDPISGWVKLCIAGGVDLKCFPDKWSVYLWGNWNKSTHRLTCDCHLFLTPHLSPSHHSASGSLQVLTPSALPKVQSTWTAWRLRITLDFWDTDVEMISSDGTEIQAQGSRLFPTATWMMGDVHNHAALSWSIQILKNIWKYFTEKK